MRSKVSQLRDQNSRILDENASLHEDKNVALSEGANAVRKQLADVLKEKARLEDELTEAKTSLSEDRRQNQFLTT